MITRPRRWIGGTVAVGLAAAAGIHAAVIADHYAESAVVGTFFVLASLMQLLQALLAAMRPTRSLWLIVALTNLGLILIWITSRTIGLPTGADEAAREAIGVLDASAVLFEMIAVAGALEKLRHRRPVSVARPALAAVGALMLISLFTGAVSSAANLADHGHAGASTNDHSNRSTKRCSVLAALGHGERGVSHEEGACAVQEHPHDASHDSFKGLSHAVAG